MAKKKTKFICQSCGYESPKWMGKCPSCNEWSSFAEETVAHYSTPVITAGENANEKNLITGTFIGHEKGFGFLSGSCASRPSKLILFLDISYTR